MIDHEKHLREVLEVQKKLSNEITELNNIISVKKSNILSIKVLLIILLQMASNQKKTKKLL